jgi:hypothetical protein
MEAGIRTMPLRIAAWAVLICCLTGGVILALVRGPVASTAGDCLPPPGYTGGGYQCYTPGHPHAAVGILIALAGVVSFVAVWPASGRSSLDESRLGE